MCFWKMAEQIKLEKWSYLVEKLDLNRVSGSIGDVRMFVTIQWCLNIMKIYNWCHWCCLDLYSVSLW